MLAIHDQFTHKMRDRLKTAVMGLGLVRLLQDAGRTGEARATLYSLENGFQGVGEKSARPGRRPCKANRLKGVTGTVCRSSASASTGSNASEMRTQPLSIA
jgi:hypothetical protein